MKALKITYWISTILFSGLMLMSGVMYFTSPEVEQGFKILGFPAYFRIELGTAKLLGAVCLSLPLIKGRAKEWVYAGFTINIISAIIAHGTLGDGSWTTPLLPAILLTISYITYRKTNIAQIAVA
jgi:TRAP-type C4-dicarboxylate transport system permease small subunit